MMAGARPVFADIDPRSADARSAARPPPPSRRAPRRSCRCTSTASRPTCRRSPRSPTRHNLAIVEDCCQAHLATCDGRPVGIVRRRRRLQLLPDEEPRRARRRRRDRHERRGASPRALKRLRNGGQTDRYQHDEFGVNSRLDEMQAAILRARLPLLPALDRRRAARSPRAYRRGLAGAPASPCRRERDPGHVYHLFPGAEPRLATRSRRTSSADGIETLIHYPIPIPRQPALAGQQPAECPVADSRLRRGLLAAAPPGHSIAAAIDEVGAPYAAAR